MIILELSIQLNNVCFVASVLVGIFDLTKGQRVSWNFRLWGRATVQSELQTSGAPFGSGD